MGRRKRTGRKAKEGMGRGGGEQEGKQRQEWVGRKEKLESFQRFGFFFLRTLKQNVVFCIRYPYSSETPEHREATKIPRSEVQFF